MPAFRYTAYNKKGRKIEGFIESISRHKAISELKEKGIYVSEIETAEKKDRKFALFNSVFGFGRIPQKYKSEAFFELATLLNSSIPLVKALEVVASQITNKKLSLILGDVKEKVKEGQRFSQALGQYGDVFDESYIKMIEIAEKTGRLADIMFKIAQREEEKTALNQKILPVIVYPLFVLALGFGIVAFLLAYVVPKMEGIFLSFHRQLPLITRILITSGIFVRHYLIIVLLFIVFLILIFRYFYNNFERFRIYIDGLLLKIPIYRSVAIARFTSALAFQLSAGIKLVDAIENAAGVVKNRVFIDRLKVAAYKINTGLNIEKSFEETTLFDPMFIASVSMGSQTGRLDEFMERIALFYERKLSSTLKTSLAIAEPVAILFIGSVVGFIVMSIMIPLFNINQFVR